MATARKLNILVYTGPGSSVQCVRQCMYSLRRLLSPNYAVMGVSVNMLLQEPWEATCALLVMPGGADVEYCRVLDGEGNRLVTRFVRRGGAYLGLCAGGYYGSRRCEFEVGDPDLEVVGSRELAFFPGTCRGSALAGFAYGSERGARAAVVSVNRAAFDGLGVAGELPGSFRCYHNGGGVYVRAEGISEQAVEVLAEYAGDVDVECGPVKSAVVFCRVGDGAVILTGPHAEFAAAKLDRRLDVPGYAKVVDALAADDEARVCFLKACLGRLGLEVNEGVMDVRSLSKLHVSSRHSRRVRDLADAFDDLVLTQDGPDSVEDEKNFSHVGEVGRPASDGDSSSIPKAILLHETTWPDRDETPYFDHALYYSSLDDYRCRDGRAGEWGDVLMYGRVVSSTNTMLENNYKLLAQLPTGFTLTASTQLAGRGRGSNVWVAPAGSLIMSTIIHHEADAAGSRPVVFLQYLAAIAVVEGIHSYDTGPYRALPVRLKWPNDIYARDPTRLERDKASDSSPASDFVKIGGILAHCSLSAGRYHVVLGIGLNATNERPTTSLNALLPPGATPFRLERLLARVLTRLEVLYAHFCLHGFSPALEARYYEHWLHAGQLVTLEAEGGVCARVIGITSDWGLLKVEEVRPGPGGVMRSTGKTWALQSDENSFDFWTGLVRRKLRGPG